MRRRAKPLPPSRRLTVTIDALGARGDGVPLTAPGDVALIEARGERARVIELVEQSPHRAQPPCMHYGACGGCTLQHVDEDFYCAWKRERVVEALTRAGLGDARVREIIVTPAATRRRATFAARRRRGSVILGFNERLSSNVVDLKNCLILHPDILSRLDGLRALALALGAPVFDIAVTACRNGLDIDIVCAKLDEPLGVFFKKWLLATRPLSTLQ